MTTEDRLILRALPVSAWDQYLAAECGDYWRTGMSATAGGAKPFATAARRRIAASETGGEWLNWQAVY